MGKELELFYWLVIMKPNKLVFGVGINDAGYVTQKFETIGYTDGKLKHKKVWMCPYYQAWMNMLKRCYSKKYQEVQPTYARCNVSDNWHTFSNFRAWMMTQDWEGKQLDKDLLFEGNKVYGAETCVFVTPMVNTFSTDRGAARGEWLIGVYWNKAAEKFLAKCSNPFSGEQEHLGLFTCEQEAHKAWLKRKLELAHELAAEQTDESVSKALILKYTNYSQGN